METIYCPECSTANRVGSNYCNRCGATFEDGLLTFEQAEPHGSNEPLPVDEPDFIDLESQPWLRVVGDEGEMDEKPPDVDELLGEELRDVEEADEDDFFWQQNPESISTSPRLVMGVQGLLEPLNIIRDVPSEQTEFDEQIRHEAQPANVLKMTPPPPLDPNHAREIRQLMSSEPLLADIPRQLKLPTRESLQIPWLFALLGIAILVAALLQWPQPTGTPQEWPGVAATHEVIQTLPAEANILLYWAYDPATAGEMDWIALPVIQHLLQKKSQLLVISPLPTGSNAARRLILEALIGLGEAGQIEIDKARPPWINGGYLPGGSAALPLVAQSIESIPWYTQMYSEPIEAPSRIDLAVVVAAQAEDVQQWVELVAPRNQIPVVALVGAGADPILRPYWDSQQLSGLVSGFDGASSYEKRLSLPLAQNAEEKLGQHIILQNWGHFILLLAIILGNLAALVGFKG